MSTRKPRSNNTRMKKRKFDRPPRRVTVVNPMKTPWPTRTVTRLDYTDQFDIVCTSGALSVYTFNSNGLYDPDQTGTGHQPLGFDQYATQYNRYRVLRMDYLVIFGNPAVSYSSFRCTVAHVNGSTVPSNPAIFEVPYSTQGAVSTYGAPLKLRGSFDLTKLNSDPKKYRVDDRYSALVTGNPAEVMYCHLGIMPNATATLRVHVKFVYHVEFYDIETPGSSVSGHPVDFYKKQYQLNLLQKPQVDHVNTNSRVAPALYN